ncbi:hypothetical protein PROFUN_09205 [Planoprotostelium fungivorum]|uniref:Uncharacterized protein n=1 Tax=Planoprotostelium fungivorum TaxID=1890364 RepID=A0A2P6NHM3_9EUKA|nr:hypothetical protein PROFUN_09205 [Planoprotostelium fungivorum]
MDRRTDQLRKYWVFDGIMKQFTVSTNRVDVIVKVDLTYWVHPPGIEPGSPAWKADIIPLDHECLLFSGIYDTMDSRAVSQHSISIAHDCLPYEFGMGSWAFTLV